MKLTPKTVGDVLEDTLGYRVEMNPYGFELRNADQRARLQRGSGIAGRGYVWMLMRLPAGQVIVTNLDTKTKLVRAVLKFMNGSKPPQTIEAVRLDQLDTDKEMVAQASRQPGGVRVVDADGRYLFRLSIPSKPLPDETSYEDAVRVLALEVIASADGDENDHPDNLVACDAHALRALIEGRLVDDIASTVAKLRAGDTT